MQNNRSQHNAAAVDDGHQRPDKKDLAHSNREAKTPLQRRTATWHENARQMNTEVKLSFLKWGNLMATYCGAKIHAKTRTSPIKTKIVFRMTESALSPLLPCLIRDSAQQK